jgi:hypothetical protein
MAYLLAACGDLPGPSVPSQPGQSLFAAREAVRACAPNAPQGGKNAVAGHYIGGVFLVGIIIGPAIVAANENNIRAHGEAGAVDNCLAKRGFERRDLTEAEVRALNQSYGEQRIALLDHLVGGGSLESFAGS